MNGFVYIAQSSTGFVKVGWSLNPESRIRHFGKGARILAKFPGSPFAEGFVQCLLEQSYAQRNHELASLSGGTEWFKPTPEVLALAENAEAIYLRTVEFGRAAIEHAMTVARADAA